MVEKHNTVSGESLNIIGPKDSCKVVKERVWGMKEYITRIYISYILLHPASLTEESELSLLSCSNYNLMATMASSDPAELYSSS